MPTKKTSRKKTARKAPAKKVAKKAVQKTASKKVASEKQAKKAATKKAAKKPPTAKKSPAKTAATGKTTEKKAAKKAKKAAVKAAHKKKTAKKVTAKKVVPKKSGKKPASPKKSGKTKGTASEEVTRRVSEALKKKREPKSGDDDLRKGQPVFFSLADLREVLEKRESTSSEEAKSAPKKKTAKKKAPAKTVEEQTPSRAKQTFGAASVADLLGFDPTAGAETDATSKTTEEGVPKKFLSYYRSLVKLHREVYEGLHRHAEETLRRSSKEDSGDLSSYGQHMADAGTDSFERDFALSMVSSEQEALYEIDEAIRRIREGNYGICEITGKPISRDRLRAVPFTRYSVEGQTEVERGKTRKVQKAGIQGIDGEDAPVLSEDDSDD